MAWEDYVQCLNARFRIHTYEDPLGDLKNLKQVRSLQEYLNSFDELYLRARINEDEAFSFFLAGLTDALHMFVRIFKPSTLFEAYFLAKLQEITIVAIKE